MKGHRWFNVHTINKELKELKYSIEQKLQYSYVEQFVRKPFVDEDKLEILHYIYQSVQLPTYIKQQQMITIMLAQIALDTHDRIPNDTQDETMSGTEKQLSVLAGDYYSGLYYLLLAEIKEVNLIQTLATSIRKINENKMSLFHEDYQSVSDLFYLLTEIESEMFTNVAKYFNHEPVVIDIIRDILFINRINYEQQKESEFMSSYYKKYLNYHNQNQIDQEIEEIIQNKKSSLENKLITLPYQQLQFKNTIIDKYNLSYNTSYVEEG